MASRRGWWKRRALMNDWGAFCITMAHPTMMLTEAGDPFPKTDILSPLPGSLHLEYRTCGRSNCRCQAGRLHGPYVVRRWREEGRQRKMPASKVARALIATAMYRASVANASRIVASLRAAADR